MELLLWISSNFTLLIIPFIVFLLFIKQISQSTHRKQLPPGPWKLPIVGNLLQLAFAGSLPHHALTALAKKHGPILHLQLGEVSTVVISSPRLAKEALKTHNLAIANRPQFIATKTILYDATDIVFSPYGNYWRQMHKICVLELLSAKKVRSFRFIREEEGSRVIESIRSSSGTIINLGKMIYALQNSISCRATFGSKCKDPDALVDLILEILSYAGGFDAANLFPSLKFIDILSGSRSKVQKTHEKLDHFLDQVIDEHSEKVGATERDDEDLVDVLLRLKDTGGLEFPITANNIKAITLDMFAAGTETSSTTVEWAMSELIRNPRVMEKAQDELRYVLKGKKLIEETDFQKFNYLKLVIKETLRLRNPLPLLVPRQCREEFVIDGYTIPVKTNILINFAAIARDPDYWQDQAESFIPERFENSLMDFKGTNFEFIPFGAGKRMCPGMTFGLASVEHILAHLLFLFDWKLPNGMKPEELDMSETFGATVRKKNNLCLVATPYSPL